MRFRLGLDAAMAGAQSTPPPIVHHLPTPRQVMSAEFLGDNSLHYQSEQDDDSATPSPVEDYHAQPIGNNISPSTQSSLTDQDLSSDLFGDHNDPPSADQIEFLGDEEWVSIVYLKDFYQADCVFLLCIG